MDRSGLSRIGSALLIGGTAAFLAMACGSNPVDAGGHEEPEGMIIAAGGQAVVTVDEAMNVTGSISVQRGQDTPRLTVTFVDHDGDPIPLAGRYYLEVDVTGPALAEFRQDNAGDFTGRVHGTGTGTTTMAFRLMHGRVGRGHSDYRSPDITVEVTE